MEIREMQMSDIEQRSAEIEELLKSEDADIDSLSAEVQELESRKAEILAEVEQRKQEMAEALKTAKDVEEIPQERTNKMDIKELRNTPEYIDAFAEYIKGNDKQMRNLMAEYRADSDPSHATPLFSENVNAVGVVALPSIVEDRIWTDWDKSPILSRVRKVFVKGNYRVGYEASATGAVIHTEGADAPAQEQLTLAYVNFVANYVKKWIRVSDTVLALRGEAFLNYLYDEFGHQIAIAIENAIVSELTTSTLTAQVTNTLDSTAVMAGFARLSDEATNPVAIMSKARYAAILNERTTAGAKIDDPFNGMEVLFNNTLTNGILVVDLDGVIVNFPEGMDFKFIFDDKSLAEADLIKIVGKVMMAAHLVRPNGAAYVTAA